MNSHEIKELVEEAENVREEVAEVILKWLDHETMSTADRSGLTEYERGVLLVALSSVWASVAEDDSMDDDFMLLVAETRDRMGKDG